MYQRYIYRVDLSRVNEFGQRGEEGGKDGGSNTAGKAATNDDQSRAASKPKQAKAKKVD